MPLVVLFGVLRCAQYNVRVQQQCNLLSHNLRIAFKIPKMFDTNFSLTLHKRVCPLSFYVPYFIEYNVHTSIVCTWISQWFLAEKLFLFFKNNFTRINHCKFIHHKSHLKPFISYIPCIVHREYFSIISM
jgi:hypothetical protein